jgi:Transposase zinc-ribbon domain
MPSQTTKPPAQSSIPERQIPVFPQTARREACRRVWFAWRWPEGFKCPQCAETEYSEIRDRQLLQCRQCRYQTSLIAGTILQGTKLPMRVWFRAMHLLAAGACER